jgi:hypothetical protein
MVLKIMIKFNIVRKQANTLPSFKKHNNHNKSWAMVVKHVVKHHVTDKKYPI